MPKNNFGKLHFSQRLFLAELQDLCAKYSMKISGCGCCGSPFVEQQIKTISSDYFEVLTNLEVSGERLKFTTKDGEAYLIEHPKHKN